MSCSWLIGAIITYYSLLLGFRVKLAYLLLLNRHRQADLTRADPVSRRVVAYVIIGPCAKKCST